MTSNPTPSPKAKAVLFLILVAIVGFGFYYLGSDSKPARVAVTKPDAAQPSDTTAGAADFKSWSDSLKKADPEYLTWRYTSEDNPMNDTKIYYATLAADSSVSLKSPYQDGGNISLIVRCQNKNNFVCLSVDKGQFMPDQDGEILKVRFDKNKAVTYECGMPSDGSQNMLIVYPGDNFIRHLKDAKHVTIQALFYDNGWLTMNFDYRNFTWQHI